MSKYLQESYDALLKENVELIEQNKNLLQRLERYEKALQHIADRDNCYDDLPEIAQKALKE